MRSNREWSERDVIVHNYSAFLLGILLACFVYGCASPVDRKAEAKKTGPTAAVEISLRQYGDCMILELKGGASLFRNRDYKLTTVPEALQGLKFTAFTAKVVLDYTVRPQKDVALWLLVPTQFDIEAYRSEGWEDTKLRIPVTFSAKTLVVLKRNGVKGETYFVTGNGWVNPILAAESISVEQ